MPYSGRGGAGNIEAAKQTLPDVDQDPGKGRRSAEQAAVVVQSPGADSQPYAFAGRGGAGNIYSPSQLAQNGAFSNTTAPPNTAFMSTSPTSSSFSPSPTKPSSPTPAPTARARRKSSLTSSSIGGMLLGRGGAGNFIESLVGAVGSSAAAARVEEEEREGEERQVKEQVERDVEMGLPKPQQVWLGGRRKETGAEAQEMGMEVEGGIEAER